MIQLTKELVAEISPESIWKRLIDPVSLGRCIPGCESVAAIDNETSRWVVKMTVGVITRKIDAKARILQRDDEKKSMEIKFDSKDGDITGNIRVRIENDSVGATTSKIVLDSEIDARGSFQWIVNQVIKSQLDKFSSEFIQCISK